MTDFKEFSIGNIMYVFARCASLGMKDIKIKIINTNGT